MSTPAPWSRRRFLRDTAAASVALAAGARAAGAAAPAAAPSLPASSTAAPPSGAQPWYRRCLRWGQTNLNEADIDRFDLAWWRGFWRRTQTQGVIINAGGIVAYYPTEVPFHRRARGLDSRDFFGEIARAARTDGLAVVARMDSNGADSTFYEAHPDWFSANAEGRPYLNRGLYVACVNGPYFTQHIPAVLREIAARHKPDGFTDNIWSGLQRTSICYCGNCKAWFRARASTDLPSRADWSSPVYRAWIEWNYARRLEIWDQFNAVTRAAGGPDCLWVGMNGANITNQCLDFRDLRAIAARAEIILLDDQRRHNETGFQRNAEAGQLVHNVLGWDKLIPESMAMYQTTAPTFRQTAKPAADARLWMVEGFAGGIQPWWHFVGAYQEDRRMFETPVPVMRWHAENQEFLINRRPVATVGLVWSQRNTDFFGRDDPVTMVDMPARGFMHALVRARIPYLPINIDDIARDTARFPIRTLILPNIGAMTDEQAASVRAFVAAGGGLVATGATSLGDRWGDARADFALADVFGVSLPRGHGLRDPATRQRWAAQTAHSYLRLSPSLATYVDGPHTSTEIPGVASRHPALLGFERTDVLPYGGMLEALDVDPARLVSATLIPSYPVSPTEMVYANPVETTVAGLALSIPTTPGGRVAYLPADIDRRYARDNLPDHATLLANLVRWTAREETPFEVAGPGMMDCHLYYQPGRAIFHLVNLTGTGAWRGPMEEVIPVGPVRVRLRLPSDAPAAPQLRLLVSGQTPPPVSVAAGWVTFELPTLGEHEVAVLG